MSRVSTFRVPLALVFAALVGTPPPAGADPAGKQTAFCYTNLPQGTGYQPDQPTYFSSAFQSENENYRGLFPLYVTKKYGWRNPGPEGCSYGGDQAGVQKAYQDRVAQVKAAGKQVVETGWAFTASSAAEIAAMSAAPPPAVAARPAPATPPKSPQQEAYERALNAQRPATVGRDSAASQPAPAAAAAVTAAGVTRPANGGASNAPPSGAQPAAGSETTPHYVYCHAVGMPPRSGDVQPRGNYYVSGVFSYVSSEHADQAFVDFLSRAHPTERIGIPQCSNPQVTSDAVAEVARQKEMTARRQARAIVVDTGWKPGA
jgi:hypothetical protein